MKVIFAAAEAVPFVKTGGLGDVLGSLPQALQKRGLDVRVILPLYGVISEEYRQEMVKLGTFTVPLAWRKQHCGLFGLEHKGTTWYFLDNEQYFKREGIYGYSDDAERFAFLSRAVPEALLFLGLKPGVIHCHDWHTALVSLFLYAFYGANPFFGGTKTVLSIHNIAYQGVFPQEVLPDVLGLGEEYLCENGLKHSGGINYLKGGIAFADCLTTVSRTYAEEITTCRLGEGLEPLLRARKNDLYGILNGLDYQEYNPLTDSSLSFPYRYSLKKKRLNKVGLQQEMGLEVGENIPLLAVISRLVEQKGIDLLLPILPDIIARGAQVVVLGTGEQSYERALAELAGRFPRQMAVRIEFDERLARRIYASSDIFLMPSRTEPCGLSQIIALRYGSIPLVRATGGLKDTVSRYDAASGRGNGFLFEAYAPDDLLLTIEKALLVYRDEKNWRQLVKNALQTDLSWNKSAREYHRLYQKLCQQKKKRGNT